MGKDGDAMPLYYQQEKEKKTDLIIRKIIVTTHSVVT